MKNPTPAIKTPILLLLTLLCTAVASVQSVHAATITVNSTADPTESGKITLRDALAAVNDGDTINFASPTGTIALTSGELVVDKSVTISQVANQFNAGAIGANQLAIDGSNFYRVFHISSGKTVAISGLTIRNGLSNGNGGGIYNDHATLTVSNCTLFGNAAGEDGLYNGNGGGIYNDHATLTVSNCTIFGNAAGNGGGIYNDGASGSATLTISNSTLIDDRTPSAVFNSGGSSGSATVTITNSTFNSFLAGASIYNDAQGGSATVTITNSTFNCFLAGESIYNGAQGGSATVTLTNSTLNDSPIGNLGTLRIGNTILNSSDTDVPTIIPGQGTVTSLGYNLSSDSGGGYLTATGDQINKDPMLGHLAYYGGPVRTHMLLTGSPAIDKGKNVNGLATDQRGLARSIDDGSIANASGGDGTDIGAFERSPSDIDPTLIVTKTADTNDGVCNSDCSLREAITAANASATEAVIYFAVTGAVTLTRLPDRLPDLNNNMKILGPGLSGVNALAVVGFGGDPERLGRIFTVNPGKTVTISGLTIAFGFARGNVTNDWLGGGIYNHQATLTVSNCFLFGNFADDFGGGIYNDGTLTISNSTVSGNSADQFGGAIFNGGTLTISNSTVSGNSSGNEFGIVNYVSATVTITNSTVSGRGGTLNVGTLTIGNTILNAGTFGANLEGSGTVNSLGYNLSSDDASAFLNRPSDLNSTVAMLGPLQDNGGPTFTHALLPGSPAIDAGDPHFTPPPNYDQRGTGFDRVMNGRIDIGAFEVEPVYAAQIQQPINANGTSVFNVRRGIVPVGFTLTAGGVGTCYLPPATIAVYRTGTAGNQQIDESVYSGSVDNGSNFRINGCHYAYNLSANALGAGTYEVDIQINGQIVGSGIFQLK